MVCCRCHGDPTKRDSHYTLKLIILLIMSVDCSGVIKKRAACMNLYGTYAEECVADKLAEKRCLAFRHCKREAKAYYGTLYGEKALCGSWAEAFRFGNRLAEDDTDVLSHHEHAKKKVNNSASIKSECRKVAMDLAKCMGKVKR